MVDDQTATFTTDILRQMKSNHEVWVSQKLADGHRPQPVRLRRVKQNIPSFLFRLTTGKEILDLVTNAMAYAFEHDELKSQEEADLVGAFLEVAQDWGELSSDLEAGRRVQISYDLTKTLKELEDSGFFVFGGREVQILEGGVDSTPSNCPIAILRVLRKDNQVIMRAKMGQKDEENAQPANPPYSEPAARSPQG
jgi:hypothetical protein